MPIVEAPDGSEIEFPDEMSNSDIEGVLKKQYVDRPAEKTRLADEMSKLRRQGFLGEQAQAALGAAENIARVAALPATPILKLPRSQGTGIGAGLANVGADVAEGLSAPAYWLMPQSKPLQALVAAQMAGGVPESTAAAIGTLQNPLATKAQKLESVASPLLQAGAAALIGKGLNAKDQITSTGGIPPEQQGVPIDRTTEVEAQGGTPQRGGEGEQALPQPAQVQKIRVPTPEEREFELLREHWLPTIKPWRQELLNEEVARGRGAESTENIDTNFQDSPGARDVVRAKRYYELARKLYGRTEGEEIPPTEVTPNLPQEAPPSAVTGEVPPTAPATGSAKGGEAATSPTEPAIRTSTVTEPVTQAGVSKGPGAASPGDVPPDPRQAEAIENNPNERPLGPTSTASSSINGVLGNIWNTVKGVAGQSMPKTTAADRLVGEAGVRYASSRIAARPLAQTFAAHALEGTGVDPVKFGAALTEDNLRSIRETLRQQATERLAAGDEQGSELAAQKANDVATVVGSKGSPFKTEDEYFDFLSQPETKKALQQHIQLWKEIVEPQYKQARELDPDVELPTRGQQTGARINLKAVLPDEPATHPVSAVGSPQLTGTFKKKTPFGIKAKGTGQIYDINYDDIIGNTFTRQLEIANKNAFDDALVKSGNAVIDKPGQTFTIKGEPTVAFPITRKAIQVGGETYPASKNIYVRKSLAGEYRTAANVNERHNIPLVTTVMGGLNKMALAGLTDFSVHTSNLMTALFNRPVSAKLFGDTLLSATGRSDIPITLGKAIHKAFQDNREQISELSKIGAMRPQDPSGWSGRILRSVDKTTRLVLDDTFTSLVKEGLVPDTETARREYVNQVGQYNRRLQGPITRWLRETGFGPFVTAGKTFNSLGVKMATLSPGTKATSPLAAASLRANVLSKWVGAAVLVGTLNYLLTKKAAGRPGTPVGNIDFGTNDKTGKQQSFPLLSLIGLGRGLRVTGLRGAIESKRMGLSNADAFDSAARDIVNSWVAPGAGPPVKAAVITASGYPPAVKVGRASRVAPPGSSQALENIKEAGKELNPLIQGVIDLKEGKPVSEALSRQLPRLSMATGKSEGMVKDYPKIVTMARANEFTEDVIYQARRMPFADRRKFVNDQIQRLPPMAREHARREVDRRRVFSK